MLSAEVMIANLREKLASVPPGDKRRFDVSQVISDIKGDMLGGNYGHILAFLQDADLKVRVFKGIEERYEEVMAIEI